MRGLVDHVYKHYSRANRRSWATPIHRRLVTSGLVSRALFGLEFPAGSAPPVRGATLYDAGNAVGSVTSAVTPPGWSHPIGLGYAKLKAARAGAELAVGSADAGLRARLIELPFDIN